MAHDPNKFWNTIQELEKAEAYVDFEGMADPREVLPWVKKFAEIWNLNEFQRDLLLHFTHESLDQTDFVPATEEMHSLCYAIENLTTVKEWMKSNVDWDEV